MSTITDEENGRFQLEGSKNKDDSLIRSHWLPDSTHQPLSGTLVLDVCLLAKLSSLNSYWVPQAREEGKGLASWPPPWVKDFPEEAFSSVWPSWWTEVHPGDLGEPLSGDKAQSPPLMLDPPKKHECPSNKALPKLLTVMRTFILPSGSPRQATFAALSSCILGYCCSWSLPFAMMATTSPSLS